MARVVITETEMPAGLPGAIGEITLDTGDPTNDHYMESGARLLVYNSGVGAIQVTIVSVEDTLGRTGDLVQSVGAGEIWVSSVLPKNGWWQTSDSNRVYVDVDSTDARLAAIKSV